MMNGGATPLKINQDRGFLFFFPLYFFGFELPTGFQQNGISCSVMTLQTHIKMTDTSQQLTEVIHHFLK